MLLRAVQRCTLLPPFLDRSCKLQSLHAPSQTCSVAAFVPRAAASAEAGTKLSANSSSPAESPEDAIVFRPFEEVRCMMDVASASRGLRSVCAAVLLTMLATLSHDDSPQAMA